MLCAMPFTLKNEGGWPRRGGRRFQSFCNLLIALRGSVKIMCQAARLPEQLSSQPLSGATCLQDFSLDTHSLTSAHHMRHLWLGTQDLWKGSKAVSAVQANGPFVHQSLLKWTDQPTVTTMVFNPERTQTQIQLVPLKMDLLTHIIKVQGWAAYQSSKN